MLEVVVNYLISVHQLPTQISATAGRPQSATTEDGKPITLHSTHSDMFQGSLTSFSEAQPFPSIGKTGAKDIDTSSLKYSGSDTRPSRHHKHLPEQSSAENSSERGGDPKVAVPSGGRSATTLSSASGTTKSTKYGSPLGVNEVKVGSQGARSKSGILNINRGERSGSDESSVYQLRWSPAVSTAQTALNPSGIVPKPSSTSSMGVEARSDDSPPSSLSSQATPLPPSSSVSPPTTSIMSSIATGTENNMMFEDLEDFDLYVDVPMPTSTQLGVGGGARVSFPQGKTISPQQAKVC